jgi:succinate dehydrogenase/fumarate reductase cytochrome b subunit
LGHYKILNSRKRVVVALVHTVVFLGVAILGFFFAVPPLRPSSPPSGWILAGVYTIVSSILLWLTAIAAAAVERLYFALCATSAGFGLLRQLLGDPSMHIAVYVRVAVLACAVIIGIWLLQASSRSVSSGSTRVARRAGR